MVPAWFAASHRLVAVTAAEPAWAHSPFLRIEGRAAGDLPVSANRRFPLPPHAVQRRALKPLMSSQRRYWWQRLRAEGLEGPLRPEGGRSARGGRRPRWDKVWVCDVGAQRCAFTELRRIEAA